MTAIEKFEAVEANLVKLERLCGEIQTLTPDGITFGEDAEREVMLRAFGEILAVLPKIDGWKPQAEPPNLNDLAQSRLDALELNEPWVSSAVEDQVTAPARELRDYRHRLTSKRRALVRESLIGLIDAVDADITELRTQSGPVDSAIKLSDEAWSPLREHIRQIDVLLGATGERSSSWGYLRRHASFADTTDLRDIETRDWPQVKQALRKDLYGANEPVPVDIEDLADVVAARPRGDVVTELNWSKLSPEDFERLLFSLITSAGSYENPDWLMKTNAQDQGRDLSVWRVIGDELAATVRLRTIIQCKHWLAKSVAVADLMTLTGQMELWDKPPVDLLVIATSGRFAGDAVRWIETHNAKAGRPRIEMWPNSHLEKLLAARPHLIAEFGLR